MTVDRAVIDLDAYLYDDLQNSVYERLSRPGLSSITDYLNAWVSSFAEKGKFMKIALQIEF